MQWSEWSACSKLCGGGTQTRTATVTQQPEFGGAACPPLTETRPCNSDPCNDDDSAIFSAFGVAPGWRATNNVQMERSSTLPQSYLDGWAELGCGSPPDGYYSVYVTDNPCATGQILMPSSLRYSPGRCDTPNTVRNLPNPASNTPDPEWKTTLTKYAPTTNADGVYVPVQVCGSRPMLMPW